MIDWYNFWSVDLSFNLLIELLICWSKFWSVDPTFDLLIISPGLKTTSKLFLDILKNILRLFWTHFKTSLILLQDKWRLFIEYSKFKTILRLSMLLQDNFNLSKLIQSHVPTKYYNTHLITLRWFCNYLNSITPRVFDQRLLAIYQCTPV